MKTISLDIWQYVNKNKIKTIWASNSQKNKNSWAWAKITWFFKKKKSAWAK